MIPGAESTASLTRPEARPPSPSLKPLVSPAALAESYPLDGVASDFIEDKRREISDAMAGLDDRLVVVVGPCSIHDPVAALDYASRLAQVAWTHADELLVVMRVYLEKPRTVVGWKGLINDPGMDQSFDINKGLRTARDLLLEVGRLGLPAAAEFLDTMLGPFYCDLVSWGVIGARTVESQVHRELVSGLPMPVGFKNRTDGDVTVAVDAIRAARSPHWFPTIARGGTPAVMGTSGNEHTHVVLRGGTRGPNFSEADVHGAVDLLRRHGLRPHVMVDCSHANSGKDPARQPAVARSIAERIGAGDRTVTGVMIESNLRSGAQKVSSRPLAYGQSVTDACLSWVDTRPVLDELATAVRARRKIAGGRPGKSGAPALV